MKHPLRAVSILLTVVIFVRLGNTCGPFFYEDVFQQSTDPDAPYAKFVAGRLGLLEGTYRIRHLVVAYNTLSGRGLTPAEQKAAQAVEDHYNGADARQPDEIGDRKVPGQDWQSWSAAMYLYAAACVEQKSTIFFDRLR